MIGKHKSAQSFPPETFNDYIPINSYVSREVLARFSGLLAISNLERIVLQDRRLFQSKDKAHPWSVLELEGGEQYIDT
jgi:hypothetical protein